MEVAAVVLALPPVIAFCVSTIKDLRDLIEGMKTTKKTLLDLLSRVERTRLFLEALRSFVGQLRDHGQKSLVLAFKADAYEQTMHELRSLVARVSVHGMSNQIRMNLQWAALKSDVVKLLKELRKHEEEMTVMLSLISA
jgi:molybdopterin synthase catalytic subunit